MTGSSPLYIARECQNMATKAGNDSMAFQKGAMVMMGAMVMATVAGVLLQLWKEWKHSTPTHRQWIDSTAWHEEPANDNQRRMHRDAMSHYRSR